MNRNTPVRRARCFSPVTVRGERRLNHDEIVADTISQLCRVVERRLMGLGSLFAKARAGFDFVDWARIGSILWSGCRRRIGEEWR